MVECFGHVAPLDVLEGCNPKKNSAESDSSHRGDHPRRLYELHVSQAKMMADNDNQHLNCMCYGVQA